MATILVVDDNPDACRMMAKLVTRCGGHQGDYWTKAGFNYSELPQMLGRLLPGGC